MTDKGIGRKYTDGEVIFREGDQAEEIFVIQSGEVEISVRSSTGSLKVNSLKNGDIFGEMALFDRLPRSATATAKGEVRALSIDKNRLFQYISRDPTLVLKIIDSMSRRLRLMTEEIETLENRITNADSLEEARKFVDEFITNLNKI